MISRLVLAAGLGLLVEREVRGVDVAGANDNASGAAVAATLATEVAGSPLEETRVVLLLSGSEGSGHAWRSGAPALTRHDRLAIPELRQCGELCDASLTSAGRA